MDMYQLARLLAVDRIMLCCGIQGTRSRRTLGAESVMATSGLWGMKGSSLPAFGEKRRKTEVSAPLLYYRAKRVWKGRWFGGRSGTESVINHISGLSPASPQKTFHMSASTYIQLDIHITSTNHSANIFYVMILNLIKMHYICRAVQ